MSFLELGGLGDAKEPEIYPEGEATLVVDDVHSYIKDDTKNQVIRVRHQIQDDGDWAPVYHYLSFPGEGDDEEKAKTKILMIRRYLEMAGISYEANGFNEEDLYGANFTAALQVEHDEERNRDNNRINVPRLDS